jgi:hypothetical protein|tara:strand:+ start:828 stop:1478 length:651 start_codon:yes stop_codon:yes gene_type:complete
VKISPPPLLLLSLIVLLSSCASQSDNATETPDTRNETGERLLGTPPKDWVNVFQLNNDNTRLTDFIPPDQSKSDWSTKLSFEAHTTEVLSIDPIELLFSEAETDQSRCNSVTHYNIFSGLENYYQTSVRLFLCGENSFTNRGEIKLIKAIRGNDYLYSVRIVRRTPPFDTNEEEIRKEEVALWATYLRKISVCDGSPDHPCPQPEAETESQGNSSQ